MARPRRKRRGTPLDVYRCARGERLGVYYLSEQAYCEKRVDLWLRDPSPRLQIPARLTESEEVEVSEIVEPADMGREAHERLLAMTPSPEPASLADLVRQRRETAVAEVSLMGLYGRLPLIGRADLIYIGKGRASLIVDFKFTPSDQRQRSYVTQLLLYGYLLEETGIDCSDLLLCAVLVPPSPLAWAKDDLFSALTSTDLERLRHRVLALRDGAPGRTSWCAFDVPLRRRVKVTLRAFPYERAAAKEELAFFCRYWRGTRPPKASKDEKKCACCLYNREGLCDEAAGPFRKVTPGTLRRREGRTRHGASAAATRVRTST